MLHSLLICLFQLAEQTELLKLKAKDEQKIQELNAEILSMKRAKVGLMRKMRDESDKFRIWKLQRTKEINKLKSEDRKKETKIMQMKAKTSKYQIVLKRKMEEAVMIKRRLQDLMNKRNLASDNESSASSERIAQLVRMRFPKSDLCFIDDV